MCGVQQQHLDAALAQGVGFRFGAPRSRCVRGILRAVTVSQDCFKERIGLLGVLRFHTAQNSGA